MDASIGGLQKSLAITTLASISSQQGVIARFCSDPIAAQTIAAQTIAIHCGGSESNANSSFQFSHTVVIWRPSSGAAVGGIQDTGIKSIWGANTTSEGASSVSDSAGSASVTAQDGDIIVVEIWRGLTAQGMATAYTNTVFYDGTVEDSITSNAAYILFTNDVAMSTGATPFLSGNMMFPFADGAALR